ncbi:MAG: GNAT family N-acetyltransferase [Candidatus Tectomicrobia bacterium]|uniref:GNAT family N-acetyltransferase n=1 Tax=Tectimicrobiota bacterium TaxID=2528274 RepID=A0A938B4B7_UNCTE|nr:GNAT family N-acetyltransferase [Candidatus Tectomicrobia bacterium]
METLSSRATRRIEVQLRPLEANDISNVVALWYRAWHHTFPDLHHPDPLSTWERRFRDDLACRGTVWVVEGCRGIVGFIVVMIQEHYLDQIFVDPAHQQQGIGAFLLAKAKALCPQSLTLHTLQRNTQASEFYERHGFTAGWRGINKINGLPNVEYRWQS